MREPLLVVLECPRCGSTLAPEAPSTRTLAVGDEIASAFLRCTGCGIVCGVADGIVDFLAEPSAGVQEELEANRRLVEAQRAGCDDEWLLGLPRTHTVQRPFCADHDEEADLGVLADYAGPGDGRVLVDLGAGTCWTTSRWAERGFSAIAADISLEKFVGLRSAEAFLQAGRPYFERVRFDMSSRWPFHDGSLDVIAAMASVHHAQDIDACFAEIRRVLKPDGVLLLVESTRSVLMPERLSTFGKLEREEYGMNERSYTQNDFKTICKRAGLELRVVAPGSLARKLDLVARRSGFQGRAAVKHRVAYLCAPLLRLEVVRRAITGPPFAALNWLFGMGFVGVAQHEERASVAESSTQ